LLAIGIFTLMFTFIGERVMVPRVGAVEPGGPAAAAGFAPNDLIVRIDGQPVKSYADLERIITLNAGHKLRFEVDRAGTTVPLEATPVWDETTDVFGKKLKRVTIGIDLPAMPPRIAGLVAGAPAAAAGFQTGDLIVSIDGKPVRSFTDMQKIVSVSAHRELAFEIDRGGTRQLLKATPAERDAPDGSGAKVGVIGIKGGMPEGEYRHYGPIEAFGQAVARTYTIIADNLTALFQIATQRMPADQLRGPLGIAEMTAQVATWGPVALLNLVAFISVAIGFFNLLPVPVLDGGHLLFYAIEAVRREPLSERTQEISFRIGLALVLLLFVFVTGIDVRRWMGLG
jgi:regulator of sigma E protease